MWSWLIEKMIHCNYIIPEGTKPSAEQVLSFCCCNKTDLELTGGRAHQPCGLLTLQICKSGCTVRVLEFKAILHRRENLPELRPNWDFAVQQTPCPDSWRHAGPLPGDHYPSTPKAQCCAWPPQRQTRGVCAATWSPLGQKP